jgi:hypothetical protein
MAVYLKIIYFVIRQAHDDRVRRWAAKPNVS